MKRISFCLAALLLAANLQAGVFARGQVSTHCGFKVVSYKFIGNAGTEIAYGNRSFKIPETGVIELVAQRNAETYRLGSRSFQLPQNAPTNEFGSVTIELYKAASLAN